MQARLIERSGSALTRGPEPPTDLTDDDVPF